MLLQRPSGQSASLQSPNSKTRPFENKGIFTRVALLAHTASRGYGAAQESIDTVFRVVPSGQNLGAVPIVEESLKEFPFDRLTMGPLAFAIS